MKKIKQKLLLRSPGRGAHANEDCDFNANSTGVRRSTHIESTCRGSTYSGSTYNGSTYSGSTLMGGQSEGEGGPWGLKELYPGKDAIVE